MKKIILIAMLAFAPALFVSKVYAQKPSAVVSDKPGWHKMAETIADFNKERDEILVVGRDSYKALKLKVTDAPIHIYKMTIVYGQDMGQEEVAMGEVPGELMANGESKVINLKNGANKNIQKVVYSYRSVGHNKAVEGKADVDLDKDHPADKTGADASVKVNKRAHVELWGLK
jgi:hypothetical protein